MHIGLIGGIGPAATDYYYRGLLRRYAASGDVLQLTIAHADVSTLSANVAANEPERQAEIFLALIERLCAAGADMAAVTSMAGHFCIREVEARSPLPIVSALPALNRTVADRGLTRVGLLATQVVMGSAVYGTLTAAQIVVPEGRDFDQVHDAYVGMATSVGVTERQRLTLFAAGRDLVLNRGAEAVILGGTDMFLAFDGADCGLETIDCADIHVDAIYRASIGNT